jgi:hypothetical protein
MRVFHHPRIGNLIQLLGVVLLGIGFGIEIAYHADYGYITLTAGSIIFTVATKIKHG